MSSRAVLLLASIVCTTHARRVQIVPQVASITAEEQLSISQASDKHSSESPSQFLLALSQGVRGRLDSRTKASVSHTAKTLNFDNRQNDVEYAQASRILPHSSTKTSPLLQSKQFARVCLVVLVVFNFIWSTLPLITQSRPTHVGNRAPNPAMAATREDDASGTASVSSSIIVLAKNIVGSGVLTLPFGVAAFTAAPVGVLPALVILLVLGALSAYAFSTIARVGNEVGGNSYQDIWAKSFGDSSAIIPAVAVIFKSATSCLCYPIILGDSFASIASLAGLSPALCSANSWILGLSGLVLLPLCLMRNLSALAIGSVIGTAGTMYTALFMWLRLLDGSYVTGGRFYSLIPASSQPLFAAATASSPLINSSIFVLVSMLSSSFLAHFNAPKFYQELSTPADGNKQGAFNKMVAGAFALAALLCALIMTSGFLTFGGASQGFILNSYATSDSLAFLARLGICTSVLFSYPIIFLGLRGSVLNTLKLDGSKGSTHVISTVVLLCAINGISLVVKNLGLVVAVAGAILGSALVYIFPAMMFIKATRMKRQLLEGAGKKLPRARSIEMYANYCLAILGLLLGVIGVKMTLKSAGL